MNLYIQALFKKRGKSVPKLIALLLLAFALPSFGKQDSTLVSLQVKNTKIEEVLLKIEQQTGIVFYYSPLVLDGNQLIDIVLKSSSIDNAINRILDGKNVSWRKYNKSIIISSNKTKSEKLKDTIPKFPLKGFVTDRNGRPITGATVIVKNTNIAAISDSSGIFFLDEIPANSILTISSIGYEKKELKPGRNTYQIKIELSERVTELKNIDVYSTGYQKISKERATGSFSFVDNQLYNRQVGSNAIDRILNVTSGLISNSRSVGGSGQLGGIMIRGISTINADKQPLLVVDNFPYEGDINNINPNDVENVTVLKDAAAASIWGARAGNGVIVITTKKGKFSQRPKISLTSNFTIGFKPDLYAIPLLSSKDQIAFEKSRYSKGYYNSYDDINPSLNNFSVLPLVPELLLAVRRGEISQKEADDKISMYEQHDIRDDLNKYLLQNSTSQQYALNISGGDKFYNYYLSIGYDKNRPVDIRNNTDRVTLNFNNIFRPVENIELNGFITYTQGNTSNRLGVSYRELLPTGSVQVSPYTQLSDNQGNALSIPKEYRTKYVDTAKYPALLDWTYKPLAEKYNSTTMKQSSIRLGGSLAYTLLANLQFKLYYQYQKELQSITGLQGAKSYNVRSNVNKFMNYDPLTKTVVYPFPLGDILSLGNAEGNFWNSRVEINYNRNWRAHKLSAIAGYELRQNITTSNSSVRYGFNPDVNTFQLVNPTILYPTRPSGAGTIGSTAQTLSGKLNRFGSYFGNAGYTYKDRYTFTASGRIDESNFFGVKANQRKIPLWSGGLGWIISEEKFYNIHWLPLLKIRSTYGYNGNTNSGASTFATIKYNVNPGFFQTNAVFAQVLTPPNPELRWEKVQVLNFGIDFSMKSNRISGSLEYYQKNGVDLLGPIFKDPTTGIFNFTGNHAQMKGNGADIVLNTNNLINKVKWSTNFLFSINTDKVTAYGGTPPTTSLIVSGVGVAVGQPLFSINSYRWAGLNPLNGTPRIYLSDTISTFTDYTKAKLSDLHFDGRRIPKIFGSIRNTISYKSISLSANITYKLGYYYRRSSVNYQSILGGWGGHNDYLLRWQKAGDELLTNVPSMPEFAGAGDFVYGNSNILTERADHIRLTDARLSYDFNKSLIRNIKFQSTQIFVYSSNLGILWKKSKYNIDPDAASFGSFPEPISITIGLMANF